MRRGVVIFLACLPFVCAASSFAQTNPPASFDATALVRRAVQHRLDEERNHHPLEYLLRKTDERHDIAKLIIETKDGDVARIVAVNGKPVSPDVNQAELARLDNLAAHPELQEHTRKVEQRDQGRVDHLLSQLPDAFLYKLDGIVPCPAGQCYHLTFTPNPRYVPPDTESRVFRGISGEAWIEQSQERLNRLDAHFLSDVDFGFGILGRVDKGGVVRLEQDDIGGHDWELTDLEMHLTGTILLVKSFRTQLTETISHFAPVPPNLTYRDAIQMLKKIDPSKSTYTP